MLKTRKHHDTHSVTSIGLSAFGGCSNLKNVYYNGTQYEWDEISIGSDNTSLTNATRKYFYYVFLYDENRALYKKIMNDVNSPVDSSELPKKEGYSIKVFTDKACTNIFDSNTPINQNTTLYYKYVKVYTYKFLNGDSSVLLEKTVPYETKIEVPSVTPTKASTAQYTYTFSNWSGYTNGMTVTKDITFSPVFNATVNQYTYKFIDNDKIIKEESVDYGTTIVLPEKPADKDQYTFDYWDGYSDGLTLTGDIEFKAVYKFKDYSVTVMGSDAAVTVTYNDSFKIEPQEQQDYYFKGYFTEENGKGIQITDENGNSIAAYSFKENITVYPHFVSANKITVSGEMETHVGAQGFSQTVSFEAGKDAIYLICTLKFPEKFELKEIVPKDFIEVSEDSRRVENGYTYVSLTGIYDSERNVIPKKQIIEPFILNFDISKSIECGEYSIDIESAYLSGYEQFKITDIESKKITVKPQLAERIEIMGDEEIDSITKFVATVYPDYASNKEVVWSVDDETVVSISQDGTVTPLKTGVVTITATSEVTSEIYAEKTVNVIVYATINTLTSNVGEWSESFKPEIREYTIYVDKDVSSIILTPSFTVGGVLRLNNTGIWMNRVSKTISLAGEETVITLNRQNAPGLTNNEYKINIIKLCTTKTTVSDDGKIFTVKALNISDGARVILALYNDDRMVDIKTEIFSGEDIVFETTDGYSMAKVMVVEDLTSLTPVCNAEIIQ